MMMPSDYTFSYNTINTDMNTSSDTDRALANYRSTYLRFKEDDVVASAYLRYIHYGWQFMFNYHYF